MDEPERPDPNATLADLYEWMEEDFWYKVATGLNDDADEDERDVVEAEIINYETGEVVGTIDTDGNLDTESEALRDVSQRYLETGVPVLVPTTHENDEGEIEHADAEILVQPGTKGFVRAYLDELPSPFDGQLDTLNELPVYDE